MSRDYRRLIKEAQEDLKNNTTMVITREELISLRTKYDKKYTLHQNRLEGSDVFKGRGRLQGVKLIIGKWVC